MPIHPSFHFGFLGAHIPDISSGVGFLDMAYLGLFAILSPAFDFRSYNGLKLPSSIVRERAHALNHFNSLLLLFSDRYTVLLEGVPVAHSYVVNRLLAEFAAATVVFAKAVDKAQGMGADPIGNLLTPAALITSIEGAIQESCPRILPYYVRCIDRGHKDFVWTGPRIQILPRREDLNAIIGIITSGEKLDCPAWPIYPSERIPPPNAPPGQLKRLDRTVSMDLTEQQSKKRKLLNFSGERVFF